MCKIMVVDDEQDFREMVCLIMQKDGHDIIEARNGKECLKILEAGRRPDLILLDIMMPEMNGWETFDRIKENAIWRDIPIIFLTVRKDELSKSAGAVLGEAYVTKPFDVTDLKKRIDGVLRLNHGHVN